MNIAIVGSSGYIAGYLIKELKKSSSINTIIGIDQTEGADLYLNLLKPDEFDYSNLETIDVVIFTAAVSGPDKCASDYDFCYSVNVRGTCYFIKEAIERNCRIIFFSSDAVYGEDKGIFNELSETCANTAYGRMKKIVEDKFKSYDYFKAIRLSYVMSVNDRFVSYCLECVKSNSVAQIYHPFYRNCVTVTDVTKSVIWLILNWNTFKYTFLNIAGKELISRVRIADEINRLVNGKLKYEINSPPSGFFENRPKITQMESLYLFGMKIINDESFFNKLKYELKEMKL